MKVAEKLVPELRFPRFEGQWSNKRLRDVLVLNSRPFKMDDESEYSLVTVKRRYGGVVLRGIYKGKEIKVKSQFKLEENDFIISKRQISHNACGIVPKDLEGSIVSNEYSVFKPQLNLDIKYFNYFCHLPKISHSFFLSSIGVHIEKMLFKVDDWFKWKFCFPTLPEQQKIASFLLAMDKKIEKLTRKKDLLEKYKTGVMQKIFSQEIRFKDENGKNFPDWAEKKIKTFVIDKKSGMKIGPFGSQLKKETFVEAGYKVYGQENVFLKDFHFSNRFITETHFDKLKTNQIKPGDFLISTMGTIGKSCVVPLGIQKGIMDSHIIRLRLDEKIICSDFLKQIFLLFDIQKQIKRYSVGGIMDGLSMGIINELKFIIPKSIVEQQKIANFLSTIDKKIQAVQTKLTQTQAFKKGLLQKMFV
ncbi:MAG: restriction endonuclease subunit S [Desulfobacula sp.]|nr:restriction endonuclease subunit S [Desulfobacula sp.]